MSDYSFETLNDKEFEVLATDLLAEEFDAKVERFKSGRDGGVDGRFFEGEAGEETVIIQCKHWLRSGIQALLSKCRSEEVSKVGKLSPSRYIFVTSLPLSPNNKKEILEIFEPFIKHESDIFGNEDLNTLIKKHPNIERSHYKLWLSSTNVLQTILHNDILGRSEFYVKETQDFLPKYVITENHFLARRKLDELGSIIVNGEPGVGKTTLAKQLCLDYASLGYQLIVIHESITEAERLYSKEAKQIFYFDDFLGSNFLSAIESKQDSDIVHFMKRISKDNSKRFVLTTRSNILNRGKLLSERFNQGNIDRNEYEVKIQSLSKIDKAKILYNHIYFGNLKESFVEQLYIDKRYRKIISHRNFNPRLIEFITDAVKVNKLTSTSNYWNYIQETLDKPREVWRGLIDNQIGELGKHIVISIALNGRPIDESQLSSLLCELKEHDVDFKDTYNSIDDIVRGLSGSVLNRNISENRISFSLFNPSIADFVLSNYMSRVDYIVKIISCLRTHSALSNLEGLKATEACKVYYKDILAGLINYELGVSDTNNYTIKLVELAESAGIKTEPLIKKIIRYEPKDLVDSFGLCAFGILKLAIEYEIYRSDDRYICKEILRVLENEYLDYEQFTDISQLLTVISNKNKEDIFCLFKKKVIDTIYENITEWAIEREVFSHVFLRDEFSYGDAEQFIMEIIEEWDLNIKFEESDIDDIYYGLDIDEIIIHNEDAEAAYERGVDDYRELKELNNYNSDIDPIDDLFN